MTQAYPLQWPAGWPRTPVGKRERGQFKTAYETALRNVASSLRLFGQDSGKPIKDPILSTNVDLLGRLANNDPGVSVWFSWDGLQVCIAVDRYLSAASNLQAIHHIIEARRVELRHGTLHLVRASFQGFMALPAPAGSGWWEVLGVSQDATTEAIEAAYRAAAKRRHPDAGGSTEAMAELNAARAEGLRGRA